VHHPSWCTSANALYYNAFLKATARKAAAIVCVSQQTAGDVNRNFPFCKDKTHVVYPGIDTAFNSDQDFVRCSQVKLQYHLPDRFILFVGNFEPKKNLVTLIRAYKLLRKMGITHKLVLVGKRSWKANPVLREIAEDQSISSIVCPGYVDRKDLPWVYKLADLFVFISLYEGFGFPPLEAMSCGTCVVSSGKGALGETMGQTACNVAPDDSDQVAQVVYDVLRSDELKKKFILEGKASASAFKWEKTAKEMLGVYQRVLNHSTELAGKATV
jgi:glycosyltransferase involved in cell wall biosynthesis